MQAKMLKKGTIVHVSGFPVELAADVEVLTFDGNWAYIEEELKRPPTSPGSLTSSITLSPPPNTWTTYNATTETKP